MRNSAIRLLLALHTLLLFGLVAGILSTASRETAGQLVLWATAALVGSALAGWWSLRQQAGRAAEQILQACDQLGQGSQSDGVSLLGSALKDLRDAAAWAARERTQASQDRDRLATVLSSMWEGVVAVDVHERVLLANRASADLLQVKPQDAVGRPIREVIRASEIHEFVGAVLRGEAPEPIECLLPPSGRITRVGARVMGDGAGAVIAFHDISDLRRLERIRQEFVANVSHELKTPLTAIQACADTLSEGALGDPAAAERFLSRIHEQCARLGELIGDMLSLARIESGDVLLEIAPVDLGSLLQECVRQRNARAVAAGLELHVELRADVTLPADATALRTLVGNLVDNSLKYTPSGGEIHVRLERTAAHAIVSVQDTGIGIDRQHINRIFQRFYRVDSARSRASGGSGLGLAIVKHLTEQLGGTIEVSSEPQSGSTFRVSLPLQGPRCDETADPSGDESP